MVSDESIDGDWYIVHVYNRKIEDAGSDNTTENPTTEVVLNGVAKISEGEAQSFDDDVAVIGEFSAAEKLIYCVERNVTEFFHVIENFGTYFHENKSLSPEQMDAFDMEVTRVLMNVMSLFRSFVDHGETYLNRKFGADSEELREWKRVQAREFDDVFAYRFLSQLRNYIQHVDTPPLSLEFSAQADKEAVTLRVDLNRDKLIEAGKDIFKKIKTDLEQQPEKIPLYEMMQDWSACLQRLSLFYVNHRAGEAQSAAQRMLAIRERIGENTGTACVAWIPTGTSKPSSLTMSLKDVPERIAMRIVDRPQNSSECCE